MTSIAAGRARWGKVFKHIQTCCIIPNYSWNFRGFDLFDAEDEKKIDKSCHVTSCQETMWTWKAKTNSFQCNMARVTAFCSLGRANLTHEMLLDAQFSLHLATLTWVVQRLNAQVLSFWVKSEAHVLWNSGVWAIFPGHGCIFWFRPSANGTGSQQCSSFQRNKNTRKREWKRDKQYLTTEKVLAKVKEKNGVEAANYFIILGDKSIYLVPCWIFCEVQYQSPPSPALYFSYLNHGLELIFLGFSCWNSIVAPSPGTRLPFGWSLARI